MSVSDSDEEPPTLVEAPNALLDPNVPPKSQDAPQSLRVPLTIICGFLGAGKSTLLKRILTERHGYRIAVIMNEFGDTADIEAKAINVTSPDDPNAEASEEFLELANGCLCCSIKDSGAAAIEKLMLRKGAFDYILLETTGLADPGPIASMFWHNEEYATGLADIVLDGVVCVVDAMFGKKQMQEDHAEDELNIGESLRQIAGSDVIILNKIDLVETDVVAETESMIRSLNPAAPVYRTVEGQIDLKHILGISAYQQPPPVQTTEGPHVHSENCDHDHETPPTHYEIRGVSSLQVSCHALDQPRLNKLDEWIRSVLWENQLPGGQTSGIEVLRCKGAFSSTTGVHYVLQGVRSMYNIEPMDSTESIGIPETGKIVLIGKGLDDSVRRSLELVLA
ncbi:CobW domain-containing protein [Crassisporium funariophilum]|nr:CobW domain-containing protein [Crassisporium funariophilum]